MGCTDLVCDRKSAVITVVTGDYANVTVFENLKLFPERASNSTKGSAQSFIPAFSVIGACV